MGHLHTRGCFLVRESEQNPGGFALSIKDYDQERLYHVKHYKIKPLDNLWKYRTVMEKVGNYLKEELKLCGSFSQQLSTLILNNKNKSISFLRHICRLYEGPLLKILIFDGDFQLEKVLTIHFEILIYHFFCSTAEKCSRHSRGGFYNKNICSEALQKISSQVKWSLVCTYDFVKTFASVFSEATAIEDVVLSWFCLLLSEVSITLG